jgi:hypothetical protein
MKDKPLTKKEQITAQQISDAILGGTVNVGHQDHLPDYIDKDYNAEIAKIDPNILIEDIVIKDDLTGRSLTVQLDRGGTRDQKLALVLADPNSSDQQKASMVSLWLFEKGKESSSFLLDLMQSKGTFVKQARQFQSQMNYDWTYFIGMFCSFLYDQATTILSTILPERDLSDIEQDAFDYMKKQKEKNQQPSLHQWAIERYHQLAITNQTTTEQQFAIMLLEVGVRFASEASSMKNAMQDIVIKREQAAGKPFPEI